jgi:hypothetical protein
MYSTVVHPLKKECWTNTRNLSLCIFMILITHYNKNPIYVFLEKELHGHSPNLHIHVFVSDLHVYIPRIGPHIFLRQNRQTDRGNL